MSGKSQWKERRRFPRFKSVNILKVLRKTNEAIVKPTLVNISEGGLCFYCQEMIRTRDRIRIQLSIAEFNSTVAAFARVVWTQASTEHVGSTFTGVEFVGLGESDREMIRRLDGAKRRPSAL